MIMCHIFSDDDICVYGLSPVLPAEKKLYCNKMTTKKESAGGMILLCDEWTNDQRMNALFAPLRSR